jgi:hypothetical protein
MKALYSIAILLGAFLLFQVQPLVGKYILPWFGTSSSVWATCLLFFQIMLLVGYSYAHLLSSRLQMKKQILLHTLFMLGALFFLPIIPDGHLKPVPEGNPTLGILLILGLTISIPYMLLAATSPILQQWRAKEGAGESTWRLYAISNIGSLGALLSYPFLVEPYFTLHTQLRAWSASFAVYTAVMLLISLLKLRAPCTQESPQPKPVENARPISRSQISKWLLLSGFASALLVATTNRIGQDVPAIPFLFILPLCLYLITYIISFDSPRWYLRPLVCALLPIGIGLAWYDLRENSDLDLFVRVSIYSLALFICCMSCHGELAREKPSTRHLTFFYLCIALGGALGGIFSAWVAPQIFLDVVEYPISLLGCFATVMWIICHDILTQKHCIKSILAIAYSALALLGLSALFFHQMNSTPNAIISKARNFYGVVKIIERYADIPRLHQYQMLHGDIDHGAQYQHLGQRAWKVSYYNKTSGIGLANRFHPRRKNPNHPFRIGVIGLGTGSLCAWANDIETSAARESSPNDAIHFYEINPQVIDFAEIYFTYLSDARRRGVEVSLSQGDARLTMEQQWLENSPQQFDILAVDAFSGDSIPMHLLTKECFSLYLKHLQPDGIVAFHISNRYLNLCTVVQALADEFDYTLININAGPNNFTEQSSRWALLTQNEEFIGSPALTSARDNPLNSPSILWTDDFSSLLKALY